MCFVPLRLGGPFFSTLLIEQESHTHKIRQYDCELSINFAVAMANFIQRAVKPLHSWGGFTAQMGVKHAFLKEVCHDVHMKIICAFQYELYVDETRRAALSRNAG